MPAGPSSVESPVAKLLSPPPLSAMVRAKLAKPPATFPRAVLALPITVTAGPTAAAYAAHLTMEARCASSSRLNLSMMLCMPSSPWFRAGMSALPKSIATFCACLPVICMRLSVVW